MFDFSTRIDRKGTWCTQWDFIQDRFGRGDLLPFTISDMDFKTAPCILTALEQRLQHGVFGYTRWNVPEFTSAIANWFSHLFSCHVNTDHIAYTPSVIYAVAQFIQLWSKPGDGVIVHTPCYDAFPKTILANSRQVAPAPLIKQGNHFVLDREQFKILTQNPKNRILLLCNPHNPTGKAWTQDELNFMATCCQENDIAVISDEIHMDLVWHKTHLPWLKTQYPKSVLISSASKSFNTAALNGAYVIVPDEKKRAEYLHLLKERDALSSPAVFALIAHISAYNQGIDWLLALKHYLRDNLHYLEETLNGAFPTLNWAIPESTYLAWIDLTPLHLDEDKLQHDLIHQQKVAIMSGRTYGKEGRGFIRLNVGCPREKLEHGVNALINAIANQR